MGTYVSQKPPAETVELSKDFLEIVRPLLNQPNRHKDFIINMDQTPVFFSMESKKTLAKVGAKTVNVRSSNGDTKRATYAVSVTASGNIRKRFIITVSITFDSQKYLPAVVSFKSIHDMAKQYCDLSHFC